MKLAVLALASLIASMPSAVGLARPRQAAGCKSLRTAAPCLVAAACGRLRESGRPTNIVSDTAARGHLRLRGGGYCDQAQRQLFEAAQCGDVAAIEEAVSRGGADVGASDPIGALAIHMASTRGHTEAVRALLLLGASVNSRLCSGPTALHLAAEGGHDETAAVLVEHGAKVDAPAEFVGPSGNVVGCSWTPVFFAAAHGHLEVVRCLLKHGARVKLKDEMGFTPLDLAERWRQRPSDMARDPSALKTAPECTERAALVQLLRQVSDETVRSVPEQVCVRSGARACVRA